MTVLGPNCTWFTVGKGGVWGVPYIPTHMAMYSAMMFVPTHTMFVPTAILSQNAKKPKKSLSHVCPEWEIY